MPRSNSAENARDAFTQALDIPESERDAYLDKVCGVDTSLRNRLAELLAAHACSGTFMQGPVIDQGSTVDHLGLNLVGQRIGPYRLLELLGIGGMGVVYVAEQTEPIRRRVALKVIKPGMDTRQVIARFEAERQTLALMDHPNIAKVLDAGTTSAGLPYFVMELVKGVSITEHCDTHKLDTRARLRLFVTVCHAIQHAHQKGIIHRDIKPSNVLVEVHDITAVPKIIDFGVAKALGQQLSETTLYTAYAQVIGTPLYMSPEQAGHSSIDIDTRSDVYSLGVLLYELLTGRTPFESERLNLREPDEMRRIIREVEPLRPSSRISTLDAAALSTISNCRQAEPRQLVQQLRGELDWVVMKALEKDRRRRYESASTLAADVDNYLNDQPVLASPQTSFYRTTKFVRRNRATIMTIAVVVCAMLWGTGVSVWQLIDALHAREVAYENQLLAENASRRANEKQTLAEANFNKVLEAVDNILHHLTDESVRTLPQMDKVERDIYFDLLAFHRKLAAENAATSESRKQLAEVCMLLSNAEHRLGQPSEGLLLEALRIFYDLHQRSPNDRHVRLGLGVAHTNIAYHGNGSLVERAEHHKMALNLLVPLFEESPNLKWRDAFLRGIVIHSRLHLASLYRELGVLDKADVECAEAEAIISMKETRLLDSSALVHQESSRIKILQNHLQDALTEIDRAIDVREQLFRLARPYPSNLLRYCNDWSIRGDILTKLSRFSEAEIAYRKSLDIAGSLCDDHPDVGSYKTGRSDASRKLVALFAETGRLEDGRKVVIELPAESSNDLQFVAECYRTLEYLEESREAVMAAVRINPNDHVTLNKVAWSLAQSTHSNEVDLQLSLELAKKAVQLAPHAWNYWSSLGVCQKRMGEWRGAIASFKECLRLRRKPSSLHDLYLSICYSKLSEGELAAECFRRATEVSGPEPMSTSEESKRLLAITALEASQLLGVSE